MSPSTGEGRTEHLGEFEHLVVLAVLRLDEGAYGVPIREEIVRRAGRQVSYGAVYSALRRMESKGWLTAELGDPRSVPGGRARKYYRLTERGLEALDRARRELTRMSEGLTDLPSPGLT